MAEMELIREESEGYLIEFKESVSDSLAKEMVAFANSSGGRIFLGVSDDGMIKWVNVTKRLRSQVQDIARKMRPAGEHRPLGADILNIGKPREKLMKRDVSMLANGELLTVLIGRGVSGVNVHQVASEVEKCLYMHEGEGFDLI